MIGEALLTILLILSIQLLLYVIWVQPRIRTWGATPEEVHQSLPGDALAASISATRTIAIDAPQTEVWKWVTQLGGDRAGFFSYVLLERLLGYEAKEPTTLTEFPDIAVGRVIQPSPDETAHTSQFIFPVLAVDPGESIVLGNWGTFALKATTPTQTRLIVRTNDGDLSTLASKTLDFFMVPAHYLMERRMLLGIKSRAETGAPPSALADNLWLLGIALSGIGLALLALLGHGLLGAVLAVIFGIGWLWTLLVLEPRPVFSLGLSLLLAAALLWLI